MANIYDLANELERGIRALPEYKKKLKKSRAAIEKQIRQLKELFQKNLQIFQTRAFMLNCNLDKCLLVMNRLKCKN